MIPRVVHQIWLQGGKLPEPLATYADGVATLCDSLGWTYHRWSIADAPLGPAARCIWERLVPSCCCRATRSDLLRYLLLWEHGGWYLDTDIELWRLPEGLDARLAYLSGHRKTGRADPFAAATVPGHPYWCRLIDVLLGDDGWTKRPGGGGDVVNSADLSGVCLWGVPEWFGERSDPRSFGRHHALGPKTGSYADYCQWPK